MQNLITASHTVCVHVEVPRNFLDDDTRTLSIGAWLTTINTSVLHLSYYVNLVAVGQPFGRQQGSQKFGGDGLQPLRMGHV